MPDLDVSDVLADPDFADVVYVTRTTQFNVDGRNVPTQVTTQGVSAVVQPASSGALLRLPELLRQQGTVTVYTTFRLSPGLGPAADGSGAGVNDDADIVGWGGQEWTVVNVDDWSRFGAGYVRATCTLRPPPYGQPGQ